MIEYIVFKWNEDNSSAIYELRVEEAMYNGILKVKNTPLTTIGSYYYEATLSKLEGKYVKFNSHIDALAFLVKCEKLVKNIEIAEKQLEEMFIPLKEQRKQKLNKINGK